MEQPIKLLLVDDNQGNLDLLVAILEGSYELRTATSGEEALAIAPAFGPDIVLLDIMMPGMNGYETCRRLRQHPQLFGVKVLLVSAKTTMAEKLEGYKAGADDYIVKPFDDDELCAKIRVFARLKSVEEIDKTKSAIFMLLDHETRTPLNGVLGPLQLLSEAPDLCGPEQAEMVGIALRSAERLADLLDKALLFVSLRSRHHCIRPERCDLAELLAQSMAEAEAAAREKDLKLVSETRPNLRLTIEPALMKRVVAAILDNAIRHSHAGGTVVLRTRADDNTATIEICDQGPGIAEDARKHLFDAFYSADALAPSQGHRLSLALAREIVARHRGRIEAGSTPGGGATFAIHLPRVMSAALYGAIRLDADDTGAR